MNFCLCYLVFFPSSLCVFPVLFSFPLFVILSLDDCFIFERLVIATCWLCFNIFYIQFNSVPVISCFLAISCFSQLIKTCYAVNVLKDTCFLIKTCYALKVLKDTVSLRMCCTFSFALKALLASTLL